MTILSIFSCFDLAICIEEIKGALQTPQRLGISELKALQRVHSKANFLLNLAYINWFVVEQSTGPSLNTNWGNDTMNWVFMSFSATRSIGEVYAW